MNNQKVSKSLSTCTAALNKPSVVCLKEIQSPFGWYPASVTSVQKRQPNECNVKYTVTLHRSKDTVFTSWKYPTLGVFPFFFSSL